MKGRETGKVQKAKDVESIAGIEGTGKLKISRVDLGRGGTSAVRNGRMSSRSPPQ